MIVTLNLLDGHEAEKTEKGWEFTVPAFVDDVEDSGITPEAKLIEATNAVIAQVGDIGADHPSEPDSKIVAFRPRAVSSDQVQVGIVYRKARFSLPLNQSLIEVGASLSEDETTKDADGNPFSVEYTYPANYPGDKAGQTWGDVGDAVQKLVPSMTIVVTRREAASPGDTAKQFVGKVNDGPWSLDSTANARQWLCTSITGRSEDGGLTYTVVYQFERRETWDLGIYFINPDTGKPPADLVDGVGIKQVQLYTEADFDLLGLP